MGDIVRRDKEDLEAIAKDFANEREKWASVYLGLKTQASVLEGGLWVGEVARAFYNELTEKIFPAYEHLLDAFEQSQASILKINQIFDEGEDQGKACINNLNLR